VDSAKENVVVVKSIRIFIVKRGSSPVTGLDRPRAFQEIKAPRFRNNGTGWW